MSVLSHNIIMGASATIASTDNTNASGTQHTISSTDVVHSTTVKKIGATSMKWPAVGDYLAIADHADWDFGTGDFTWEMWLYSAFSASGHMELWGSNQWGTQTQDWLFDVTTNGAAVRIQFHGGAGSPEYSTSAGLSANTWTHVAAVRESGHTRIYIDGVQRLSVASALNQNLANAGTPLLGYKIALGTTHAFVGYMDEIRISTSCRYPSGTTFTPSTEKFADDTDTVLLIHSDTTDGDTTFSDASGQ